MVNIMGEPCSGKSALAHRIFYYLKKRQKSVAFVSEFAKDLTWEGRFEALGCQPYVLGEQLLRTERVYGKVDIVVCESPLILSVLYNNNYGDLLNKFAIESFKQYDGMNFLCTRNWPFEQKGRNQNETQCAALREKLIDTLRDEQIDFSQVCPASDFDEIVAKILSSS